MSTEAQDAAPHDTPDGLDLRGLPRVTPPDPERMSQERAWLSETARRPLFARASAYVRRGGPGYVQSALTLGGGSASASLLSGAAFGYELLWVPPLAMALGVLMLSAVAHQTLSTGMRPFQAMRTHAGGVFAWGWVLGTLLSSTVWHFAQYSTASAVLVDIGEVAGLSFTRGVAGIAILIWAVFSSQLFGGNSTFGRWFDTGLKVLVWGIVLCFGAVAIRAGVEEPGAILRGFTSFRLPADRGDASALALALSGVATAVGVNMVFLYPYSLLARGWGREHRELARFDLLFGMAVPYVLATALMTIAAANTIQADFSGTRIGPLEAAQSLGGLLGPVTGRLVFDLGLLAMLLTTITLHMVCAGFAASEVFGCRFGSLGYRFALLIPTPGVLGCFFWKEISFWLNVPTSLIGGLMLPLTYFGFVRLQRNRAYLGDDRPRGVLGALWTGAMALGTLALAAFFVWYFVTEGPAFIERLKGGGA